jgi:hypothetical protein
MAFLPISQDISFCLREDENWRGSLVMGTDFSYKCACDKSWVIALSGGEAAIRYHFLQDFAPASLPNVSIR